MAEGELKIVNGKACAFKAHVRSLSELFGREPPNLTELKVMHCQQLYDIQCLKSCPSLVQLNLSSNALNSISTVQYLARLQVLDVKVNNLQSLAGIERCINLVRLDASHNRISCFDGLSSLPPHSRLSELVLAGNKLANSAELMFMQHLQSLTQVWFERGKATNPMCMETASYTQNLLRFKPHNSLKVDGRPLGILAEQQVQSISQVEKHEDSSYMHPKMSLTHAPSLEKHYQTDIKRQNELQEVINFKEEVIEELRDKYSSLEKSNSQIYKDLIRKETECERLVGQVSELSRQLTSKDQKILQMQERTESLLKATAENNRSYEMRIEETDKIKEALMELKLQNAEIKALNKDYEKRLADIQNKAYTNLEQKTLKSEEMRQKYQKIYEENKTYNRENETLKDRVRELTQLLREWEFKYEAKLNQIELTSEQEREQQYREAEARLLDQKRQHEAQFSNLDFEMREKVAAVEREYSETLKAAMEKYKAVKKLAEEKIESESSLKAIIKNVMDKNREQEALIEQFQSVLVKLRGELERSNQQKDSKEKNLIHERNRYYQLAETAQKELSNVSHQLSLAQRQLDDHKTTIKSLNTQIVGQQASEQLEQRIEQLTSALDAKNVMLDDKNDTIETLKAEVQTLRRDTEARVDQEEYENAIKRKDQYKQKSKELSQQLKEALAENDTLKQQLEATAGNEEKIQSMLNQFLDMQKLLDKQQADIGDKNTQIEQMIHLLEECRNAARNYEEELKQTRRQLERANKRLDQQQQNHRQTLRDLQNEFERRMRVEIDQKEQQRRGALEELEKAFQRLRQ